MARRKTLGRKSSKSRNKKRKRTYRKTRRMRGGITEQAKLKLAELEEDVLEKTKILNELQEKLTRIANSYNLKKGTVARMLLIRELHNYDKNRLFA